MKRGIALLSRLMLVTALLFFCLLFGGCTARQTSSQQRYTATFLEFFDTVTTVLGYAASEEAFENDVQAIREEMKRYHELFDIYNDYAVPNLKTVNDHAGVKPVKVDAEIIEFLKDCREYYRLTDGAVNVMMGSVLKLWHDARTDAERDPANAAIPSEAELKAAAEHISMELLVIDEIAGTVYLSDANARLDVGAIAKGWATQKVAERAPEGMLISVGGNVCATGPKAGDAPWVVGIQDPDDAEKNLCTITLSTGSVVTSGDYQRTYRVDGKEYHHIIDPQTLLPARNWQSVSIVCDDSGLADALSTALFVFDRTQGEALAARYGADVLWVDANGQEYRTAGFDKRLRK